MFYIRIKTWSICPSFTQQDGRCCVWTGRSWRGWESSRRRWGRRSSNKSSSCRSERRSATCSSLVEVSNNMMSVCVCEKPCFCVFLWVTVSLWVKVEDKESDKQAESSLVWLNWREAVWEHACLLGQTWSWTSNCLWLCAILLMAALDLLPCLWMMTSVNTFIIYLSINWLSQSLLTWFQRFDVACFLQVCFGCCRGCCRWLFSLFIDCCKCSKWNGRTITFPWSWNSNVLQFCNQMFAVNKYYIQWGQKVRDH